MAAHVLLQAGGAWATHTRVQWGSGSPDRPWPLSFTVIPARAALLHSSLPAPAPQPKAQLSPQGGPFRLERTTSSETGNSHSPTQCHVRTELRSLKSFLQLPPSLYYSGETKACPGDQYCPWPLCPGPCPTEPTDGEEHVCKRGKQEPSGRGQAPFCLMISRWYLTA